MRKVPQLALLPVVLMVSSGFADDLGNMEPGTQTNSKTTSNIVVTSGAANFKSENDADDSSETEGPEARDPVAAPTSAQFAPAALCDALVSSAQANGLPITFFSNLIWQESRFAIHAVSRAGALGIAQFMPGTAAALGLEDPLDPMQALPASARLLGILYRKFGNLALAAAAYNAGDRRVSAWLDKGEALPKETRNYVFTITGHPIEEWSTSKSDANAFKLAKKMPCRDVETFAAAAASEGATLSEASAPAGAVLPIGRVALGRANAMLKAASRSNRPPVHQSGSLTIWHAARSRKGVRVAYLSGETGRRGRLDHSNNRRRGLKTASERS